MLSYDASNTFDYEQLARQLGPDFRERDVVIGAYFSGREHPQHKVRVQVESFDYVAGWLMSAARLGLHVLLLHDGLSDKFMQRCHFFFDEQRRGKGSLLFVLCSPGPFTVADERFLVTCALLERFPCRSVFIVDVSDAWFGMNPATLLQRRSLWQYLDTSRLRSVRSLSDLLAWIRTQKRHWEQRKEYNVFMGGEVRNIGENPWMLKHIRKVYGAPLPELDAKPLLNCGIVGGTCDTVLALLQAVRQEMLANERLDTLNDMAVFNRCVYADPQLIPYTNGVLNSPWKTWAKSGRHVVFHK